MDEHTDPFHQTGDSGGMKSLGPTSPGPPPAFDAVTDTFDRREVEKDPWLGKVLGNYQILSRVGSGGFGAVYKARDLKLDRYAAVKVLRRPLDVRDRSLFVSEAKIIATLDRHPNIVQLYEWGEEDEHYYFVLEFLEGSAQTLIDSTPEGISAIRTLRIVRDCAEALAFAHREKVLHRDVKPGNILLDERTHRAKLCDFGLARFYRTGDSEESSSGAGTPLYMSPEQISGGRLDERSDVYSLGVTAYKLLSGKVPHDGRSLADIVKSIDSDSGTPLHHYRPDLDRAVFDLIDRAIAVDPEKRFESAAALGKAANRILDRLDRSGSATTIQTLPRQPKRARWVTRSIVAAALVLVGAPAVMLGWFPSGPFTDRPSRNTALAEVVGMIDSGDYEQAASTADALLQESPEDASLLYCHGVARVFLGDMAGAESIFAKLGDPALRDDGRALAAFRREGTAARSELEALAANDASSAAALFLATLDLADGDTDGAIETLSPLRLEQFAFDWQRDMLRKTLGQAYYRSDRLEDARGWFEQIGAERGGATEIARSYLARIAERLDDARRSRIHTQIERVRTLLEAQEIAPNEDVWSSRPLSVWIVPSRASSGVAASYLGLSDVLPWLLADGLASSSVVPIRVVERELLSEILSEQELSDSLSSPAAKLRLGQVLGARLLVTGEFGALGNNEFFRPSVIDTETTERLPVNRVAISLRDSPEAWVESLVETIGKAARDAYPLRGRIAREKGELVANIGRAVGLKKGTTLLVFARPNERFRIPDRSVVVEEILGADAARVRAIGFDASEVPSEGWYVQEQPAPGDVEGAGV